MEGLIELVAASFARHGIECPVPKSLAGQSIRSTEPNPLASLPEHSFRKKPEAEVGT
ncbi:MAG: hypothetical protein ABSG70_07340 [Terriglobales bacterium]|jgi:hypothetical protein